MRRRKLKFGQKKLTLGSRMDNGLDLRLNGDDGQAVTIFIQKIIYFLKKIFKNEVNNCP
jgi:hypothetical protein